MRLDEKDRILTMNLPPSHIIWGAMLKPGTDGLYFLPPGPTTNSTMYVELLQEELELHMHSTQCTIFMYDITQCHRLIVFLTF